MRDHNLPLVEDVRKLISGYTSSEFSFQKLSGDLNLPAGRLENTFGSESGLVEAILNYEQQNLENVFSEFDFTAINAIDGLLAVSKQISRNFARIFPCITFDLRQKYPEVRQKFVEKRVRFVDAKIKINIERGIQQDLYRPDLSPELISRIYISRLIDLHNPDFFPNETISFSVLFDVMFDTFIRGICTDKGRDYYEGKVKCMKF